MKKEHKYISPTGVEFYYWGDIYIRIQKTPKYSLLNDYALIRTEQSLDSEKEFNELHKKGALIKIKPLDIEVAKRRAIKIIESKFQW